MIKIVTDSTADLPENICKQHNIETVPLYISFGDKTYKEIVDLPKNEFCKQHNIETVPLYISFGDKTYKEIVDLPKNEFYDKLTEFESQGLPTTSQPTPKDFMDTYSRLAGADSEAASSIISIHISSKLSGTCQSANLAKKSMPEKDITVIDSGLTSPGLGLLVLYAAKAVKSGMSKEQVVELITRLKSQITVCFTVESLKYLEKNGRIGKAQALLGSILHIVPILAIEDGAVVPKERIRGSKKVLPKYQELIGDAVGSGTLDVMLIHANCTEKTDRLEDMLRANFTLGEVVTGVIGGVIGSHVGPGTWGLAFCPAPDLPEQK
jgi:DegV family protein with EDD domain